MKEHSGGEVGQPGMPDGLEMAHKMMQKILVAEKTDLLSLCSSGIILSDYHGWYAT